jgi:hypothetical protein
MTKSILKTWDFNVEGIKDALTYSPTFFNGETNHRVTNLTEVLNFICQRYTGFSSFDDLLNAKGSYRPTIRCTKKTNPSAGRLELQELSVLAYAYDWRMKQRQDARRAYRG